MPAPDGAQPPDHALGHPATKPNITTYGEDAASPHNVFRMHAVNSLLRRVLRRFKLILFVMRTLSQFMRYLP